MILIRNATVSFYRLGGEFNCFLQRYLDKAQLHHVITNIRHNNFIILISHITRYFKKSRPPVVAGSASGCEERKEERFLFVRSNETLLCMKKKIQDCSAFNSNPNKPIPNIFNFVQIGLIPEKFKKVTAQEFPNIANHRKL